MSRIYLVRSGTGNGLGCGVLVWCGWLVGGWVSSVECFNLFDVVKTGTGKLCKQPRVRKLKFTGGEYIRIYMSGRTVGRCS